MNKEIKEFDELLANLRTMPFKEQIITMKKWFLTYHSCPSVLWESNPEYNPENVYDLYEILSIPFSEYAEDEAIGKLALELSYECPLWLESSNQFNQYFNELTSYSSEYFETFLGTIKMIENVLKVETSNEIKSYLLNLLHINIITAVETYLSDAFIDVVMSDTDSLRHFVENNSDFKKRKFRLSDVYREYERIAEEAKKYLSGLMWHNIPKIIPLYKYMLNIDLRNKYKNDIIKAIIVRHDLVHRGGKSTDGKKTVTLTQIDVNNLLKSSLLFIKDIDRKVTAQKKTSSSDLEYLDNIWESDADKDCE